MKTNRLIQRINVIFLAVFCIFPAASPGWSSTYYVDYSGGSDSNIGTSTVSPFKHCPGDDNAGGIAAITTLFPGSTVIFKGGTQYHGRIDLDWSGSSGNAITYQGNTNAADWGSGKAIIDLLAASEYWHAFLGSNSDYITIKNFQIQEKKSVLSNRTGCCNTYRSGDCGNSGNEGAIRLVDSDYVTIQDCIIKETEHYDVL